MTNIINDALAAVLRFGVHYEAVNKEITTWTTGQETAYQGSTTPFPQTSMLTKQRF